VFCQSWRFIKAIAAGDESAVQLVLSGQAQAEGGAAGASLRVMQDDWRWRRVGVRPIMPCILPG